MNDTKYCLAVDIGASSGRHILGRLCGGKMELEEVYRFENGFEEKNGSLCWDLENLFTEIKNGLKKCAAVGKIPSSIGIDTWGVDFVLLDKNDSVIGDSVCYRDSRTQGMYEKVFSVVSEQEIYKRTGIIKQVYDTVFQLYAVKTAHPEQIGEAKTYLSVPDYFNFLLTGVKMNEYTHATTTSLVSAETNDWDRELITELGLPESIFLPVSKPGTLVGKLRGDLAEEVGFECDVILPCAHDTGSAVVSVPSSAEKYAYISSGTWSLMGTELSRANCSNESLRGGFTNEGGYDYRYRHLKNIMGLWIIQSVRREFKAAGKPLSFDEICSQAMEAKDFASRIDVNDNSFLAPKSMIDAIKSYCKKTKQEVPETVGQLGTVIYASLADSYGETIRELEKVDEVKFDCIHIVGGGCKDDYLNTLTAKATGKTVYAGPVEATAIGNITVQMLRYGWISSLSEAKKLIFDSFETKTFNA